MGQHEVNQHNYYNDLKTALKNKDYKAICITVLMAHPSQQTFSCAEIVYEINEMCKSEGIPLINNLSYPIRRTLGEFKKSKIRDYITITERYSNNPATYKMTNPDSMLTQKAIELAKIYNSSLIKTKTEKVPKEMETEKNKEIAPSIPQNEIKNIFAQLIESIKPATAGISINFTGDIHIHLNIGKEKN